MRNLLLITISLFTINVICQEKNFIDKPYIEVNGKADTLVVPNRIYINVLISEKDTKGKKSVEDLENDMLQKLKSLDIDTEKNVTMTDMLSNFKRYFLKATDILKAKSYSILVFDAKTTTKVFIGLEEIGISNCSIDKLEHTDEKKIQMFINTKAIENAKGNAISLTKPLNQKIGNAIYIGSFNNPVFKNSNGRLQEVLIRGVSTVYANKSDNYNTNIEFDKITITSEALVRFSLEQ
jgi:uncharacterized protein